jgi:hypothetical protein
MNDYADAELSIENITLKQTIEHLQESNKMLKEQIAKLAIENSMMTENDQKKKKKRDYKVSDETKDKWKFYHEHKHEYIGKTWQEIKKVTDVIWKSK